MNQAKTTIQTPDIKTDYSPLIQHLNTVSSPERRADALAVVLRVADETSPQFQALMAVLTEVERALMLGALLEASRLDPLAERRLWRLKQLLTVMPEASRGLFWPEAELLWESGEDAPLLLLGIARDLPLTVRPLALQSLRTAVKRVPNVYKRAMAFIALSELTQLSDTEWREAELCASRIPDDLLRTMALTRLSKAKRS